jgi:hypothetical protein
VMISMIPIENDHRIAQPAPAQALDDVDHPPGVGCPIIRAVLRMVVLTAALLLKAPRNGVLTVILTEITAAAGLHPAAASVISIATRTANGPSPAIR